MARMLKTPPSPPALFFSSILVMEGIHILAPGLRLFSRPLTLLGIPLVLGGGWLHMWATRLFRRHQTTLATLASPRTLITQGPFSLTRNPMYLAGVLILLGIGLFLGTGVPFLVPLLFGALAHWWYIRPEEGLLRKEFGEEYLEYSQRVRAWL
jgi:protein-S-isoprenylcysteine O-methyltransferase Ste14